MFRSVILAALALVALPFLAAPAASARANCTPQLVASVNPSAVGEEVTFDVGCLKASANVVYTVGVVALDSGDTVQVVVTGDFSYVFDDAGEYYLHLFQQRNGKQVLSLAHAYQTVE